jgi:hypothetical protein
MGTWQDPPVYAIVARDRNKYRDELLDGYLFVEDAGALYAE